MDTQHRFGAQLKVGDTIAVWWTPGRDQIIALRPYTGPYTGQPGWDGTRIADFALSKTGMTIFAGEDFELIGSTEPTVRELCDPAFTPPDPKRWSSSVISSGGQIPSLPEMYVGQVRDELAEFYTPDEAELWLDSPHKLLGGDKPRDRILAGREGDVLALIDQLRSGAFV